MIGRKKLFFLLLFSLSGMLIVAALFAFFMPLTLQTVEAETYLIEAGQIERIVPTADGTSFYIEEKSGRTIFAQESYAFFKKRAAFNRHKPLARATEIDGTLVFDPTAASLSDTEPCNPSVDGYNVYHVQGFIYIDPTTFIVIDQNRTFGDCPCDDDAVRRGKKANCPHVHHRTKKKIIDQARICGLGDRFPVRRCQ